MIDSALVVGGGIAGMAAAMALHDRGIAVDLIDIDPEWRVYGAGITITGPTLRAFQQLGILDRVMTDAHTANGVQVCNVAGQPLTVIDTPSPVGSDVPGSGGIMRPTLHHILSSEVLNRGIDCRLGISVDGIDQNSAKANVSFTDGSRRSYGLVIGADGLFSGVRSLIFPAASSPFFTGQACWRLMRSRLPAITRRHYFLGGPVKVGLTPVSQSEMYMFLLENVRENTWIDPQSFPERLRSLLEPYGGVLEDVRAGIGSDAAIVYRPLEAILLPEPWYAGRVVIIGDAAHATTPQLASGAGMAVEDALVLAEEVARAPVGAALSRFMERRWARCRLVVENSLQLGRYEVEEAPVAAQTSLVEESLAALAQAI